MLPHHPSSATFQLYLPPPLTIALLSPRCGLEPTVFEQGSKAAEVPSRTGLVPTGETLRE